VTDAVLVSALRDLGRHLAWPPTPDFVPAVRWGMGRGGGVLSVRRPVRRAVVLAAAALLVVLGGMVALSSGIRAALLRVIVLPGVRIEVVDTRPASPRAAPSPSDGTSLGRRLSLADARLEVTFPVILPTALGRPDDVFVRGEGDRALVTLAYRRVLGVPVDEQTGYAALLTQLRGRATEALVKKVTVEASVTEVVVGGEPGYFVAGPHEVYVNRPGLGIVADRPRLAGNTLLWTHDGVTLRLEADVALDVAVELAGTVP
jgi:hypothetical protein